MRLLIVDDHPIFRGGLRRILEDYGHHVVGECSDGGAVAEAVIRLRPDIILMDLQMSRVGGIETLTLNEDLPPTIILTVSEDPADMDAAMKAGASAYLLKHAGAGDVARMIEAVADGYTIFPKRRVKTPEPADALSVRQGQVLDGLNRGLTHKEIAGELGISQFTVRTYQERLMEKFDVKTRAELIFAASSSTRAHGASDGDKQRGR